MQVTDKAIAQAVAELGVDVPVLRAEARGDGLKLWLYGGQGEPVVWEPKGKAEPKAKAEAKVEAEAEPKRKPKPTSRAKTR